MNIQPNSIPPSPAIRQASGSSDTQVMSEALQRFNEALEKISIAAGINLSCDPNTPEQSSQTDDAAVLEKDVRAFSKELNQIATADSTEDASAASAGSEPEKRQSKVQREISRIENQFIEITQRLCDKIEKEKIQRETQRIAEQVAKESKRAMENIKEKIPETEERIKEELKRSEEKIRNEVKRFGGRLKKRF